MKKAEDGPMAEMLEKRLTDTAAKTVHPGEHVLAAVSGGADSTALLHVLCALREKGLISLSAAHFEHGIRAEESVGDMLFVRELCRKLDVPLFEGVGDVPAESQKRRQGLEETARDVRREFLLSAMKKAGAQSVALAHHADDQAETVLMHLLRGSGGSGACGMKARDGAWLRPLLHCCKEELIDYLANRGLKWREDATNAEAFTPRNALRLDAMPQIEKIYPGAVQALVRYADIAQGENAFMEKCTAQWLGENAVQGPYGVKISLEKLPDDALLARAVKRVAGKEADFEAVNRLCRLCKKGEGKFDLRGEFSLAYAAKGEIWFLRPQENVQNVPIAMQGETKLAQWGTLRTDKGMGAPVKNDPLRQELDAQACEGACLRLWQEGDRIRPLGMGGKSRLLSDVYASKGIMPQRRRYLPVLEKDGEILWAVGACISDRAKLRENSSALLLEWTPAEETAWKNTTDNGGKTDEE